MMAALGVLATYYVALSLTQMEGPWRIFERWRNLFTADDWKGRGVRCVVCVSLYAGCAMSALLAWGGHIPWPDVPVAALALAGGSVTIAHYNERRR